MACIFREPLLKLYHRERKCIKGNEWAATIWSQPLLYTASIESQSYLYPLFFLFVGCWRIPTGNRGDLSLRPRSFREKRIVKIEKLRVPKENANAFALAFSFGADGGIRTHVPFYRQTDFESAPL